MVQLNKRVRVSKKHLILALTVLALLLSPISPMAETSEAAEEAVFVVTLPEESIAAGSEFVMEAALEGVESIASISFTLEFDREKIEVEKAYLGESLSGMLSVANEDYEKGVRVAAASAEPRRIAGKLLKLELKSLKEVSKEDFAIGEADIYGESEGNLSYSVRIEAAADEDSATWTEVQADGTIQGSNSQGGTAGSSGGRTSPGEASPERGGAERSEAEGSSQGGTSGETLSEAKGLYPDVSSTWAEQQILSATQSGLLEGYPDGTFRPTSHMTRAEFVTILRRLAGEANAEQATRGSEAEGSPYGNESSSSASGEPLSEAKGPYEDVNPTAWYYQAVSWATEAGIVNGVGGGKFDPQGEVTREQIATTLYRMAGEPRDMSLMVAGIYDSSFEDSESVSSWAKAAVYWAVFNEIYCAEDAARIGSTLSPRTPADRAQIATMAVAYKAYQEKQ